METATTIPVTLTASAKEEIKHLMSEDGFNKENFLTVRNEALYIHNILGVNHHAEYDFILSTKGLFFLELNTHPSLAHGYIKDIFKFFF